jgi:hypothetical protein
MTTFSLLGPFSNGGQPKVKKFPLPIPKKILVLKAFFLWRFWLLSCNFFHSLLHHYKIKLAHLNPNFVIKITVFVHLSEVYLAISPNFTLFKYYFLLKYQSSSANCQVIGGVSVQARTNRVFLALPLKTTLKGWHTQWFYCENHDPSLPPFVDNLPEFGGSWTEESTDAKMSDVVALAEKVSKFK